MSPLTLVLIVASVMLGTGLLAVLAWLISTSCLNYVERRLARRKGLYRDLVAELATKDVTIVDRVTNLVQADYPRHEVVVVNEGSSDDTLELRSAARTSGPSCSRRWATVWRSTCSPSW